MTIECKEQEILKAFGYNAKAIEANISGSHDNITSNDTEEPLQAPLVNEEDCESKFSEPEPAYYSTSMNVEVGGNFSYPFKQLNTIYDWLRDHADNNDFAISGNILGKVGNLSSKIAYFERNIKKFQNYSLLKTWLDEQVEKNIFDLTESMTHTFSYDLKLYIESATVVPKAVITDYSSLYYLSDADKFPLARDPMCEVADTHINYDLPVTELGIIKDGSDYKITGFKAGCNLHETVNLLPKPFLENFESMDSLPVVLLMAKDIPHTEADIDSGSGEKALTTMIVCDLHLKLACYYYAPRFNGLSITKITIDTTLNDLHRVYKDQQFYMYLEDATGKQYPAKDLDGEIMFMGVSYENFERESTQEE